MKSDSVLTQVLPMVILIILFCWSPLNTEETPDAREIVERSFEVTKLAGSESIFTLTIMDRRGHRRARKVAVVSKIYDNGETEKSLMRFLSPADVKGTGFLTFDYEKKDDDMWLFMPALRKTRRIVSGEKAKSFMGSEFSYADMAPPTLSDFNFKILGEENVGSVSCWKIEMAAVNENIADDNGFSKRISFIGKTDFVTRKASYYDLEGRLEKELIVKEIKEIDPQNHKYTIMHMVMENKQDDRKSIIKTEKIVFNPDIKDEYFTIRYLERF
jgi:hypothetical protein